MATTSWDQKAGMTSATDVDNLESYADQAEASKDAAAASATAAASSATAAAASQTAAATSGANAAASASAAATSATSASGSATTATTKAAEASTSATNAATSATAAQTAQTAAETAQTAAEAAQTGAETAETNAASSATSAASSASSASTSATSATASQTAAAASASAASASETAAAASETAAGVSETNAAASASTATTQASNASTSATNAANSATAAAASESAAATSASNASTSETNAASSATNASNSATAAAASATAAGTSETNAAASETAAAASEAAASTSASNAATSETNAASSASTASTAATTATTQASAASTSATNAATSASNAATSATNAATSETNAAASESAAASSATSAAGSASAASTSASAASASETAAAASETAAAASEAAAATSATNAATSATTASGAATTATTKASEASTSASNAATSETNAATSASAAASSASSAQSSADAALAALDSFDDRYLGQKTSDPSLDNDGNALVAGALYFNTTDDVMKVYEGSVWVAAYASLSGALIANNNLSDLQSAAAARTNLGLGTAATTASTDYATSAQGALADSALQSSDIGVSVQGYSAALAGTTASYTTAEETKLAGIETGADVTDTANVTAAGALMDSEVTNLAAVKAFDPTDYATAAQGALADSAVQPNDSPTFAGLTTTADVSFGDNDKAIFGAGSDLQIYHDGSNSFIDEVGTGRLYIRASDGIYMSSPSNALYLSTFDTGGLSLYHNGNAKLATTSTGVDVTGNITLSGNVDGRDVAVDGAKLDGIEAGATADQTASEILTAIKTVDGAASGLDADLLDGQHGSYYLDGNNFINLPAGYTGWTVSDGTNSENVADGNTVTFSGSGAASVSYNTTTNTLTVSATDTNTTYSAGSGIGLSGTTFSVAAGGGLTQDASGLSHADTSTQASLTALTGANVVSDIDVDGYGHVTSLATRAMTAADLGALTSNQTITLSGDLSGSGTTSINAQIAANVVGANELNVSGNGTTSQYLRSDGDGTFTWATPPDTNTTYSAGTGMSLSGTTFNCTIDSPSEVGLGNLSNNGNNLSGSFTATGNITAYSDKRLKSNIQTIENAVDTVKALRGVTFQKDGKPSLGVIAQEVQAVLPELVQEGNEYLSVAYGNMVGVLIEAIKEQQKQIDELKAKLEV